MTANLWWSNAAVFPRRRVRFSHLVIILEHLLEFLVHQEGVLRLGTSRRAVPRFGVRESSGGVVHQWGAGQDTSAGPGFWSQLQLGVHFSERYRANQRQVAFLPALLFLKVQHVLNKAKQRKPNFCTADNFESIVFWLGRIHRKPKDLCRDKNLSSITQTHKKRTTAKKIFLTPM